MERADTRGGEGVIVSRTCRQWTELLAARHNAERPVAVDVDESKHRVMVLDALGRHGDLNRLDGNAIVRRGPLDVASGDARGNQPIVTGSINVRIARVARLKLNLDAVFQLEPLLAVIFQNKCGTIGGELQPVLDRIT